MTPVTQATPEETLGGLLFEELARIYHVETEGWAAERVARVASRLHAARPDRPPMETVVLWMEPVTAFTAPGPFVFFSRALLERCPDDETTALVVAHEIAHHDLGHVAAFPQWLAQAPLVDTGWIALAAFHGMIRRLYGPERECEADLYALELCLKAGYDGQRCLHLFHILEHLALDMGDQEAVFGPDPNSDLELAEDASWRTKARIWAWQRARGYLPIQDRSGLLKRRLEELEAPGNGNLS